MPVRSATIMAVSTDALILFHSNDGIDALSPCRRSGRQPAATVRRRRKSDSAGQLNRIVPELCRFQRVGEAGMLTRLMPPNSSACTMSAAPKSPIVMIPTRLAAARLPRKPLADIAGSPMILHVWRRAVAAELGPVVVASGDREIADIVEREGGRAVLTEPDLPTGSDRIHAAITALDPERHHDAVINVQGDMPMLDPAAIRLALEAIADPETDIATLAAAITDPAALTDTSVNKVVAGLADPARPARA